MDLTPQDPGIAISVRAGLSVLVICGAFIALYRTGSRLGDHDGDVRVRAVRRRTHHPDGDRWQARVQVHNPADVPVLVSLSACWSLLLPITAAGWRVRVVAGQAGRRSLVVDRLVELPEAGDHRRMAYARD